MSSIVPSQNRESMVAVTQELYVALCDHRWNDARVILQQIPEFHHLVLPRSLDGPCVSPSFLLSCCQHDIPIDILRAALGAMRTEDYKRFHGPKGANILHMVFVANAMDRARIQVFVQ